MHNKHAKHISDARDHWASHGAKCTYKNVMKERDTLAPRAADKHMHTKETQQTAKHNYPKSFGIQKAGQYVDTWNDAKPRNNFEKNA